MIFKVEKRKWRENGKLRTTRCYYLRYRVGDMPVDKWKSLGVTDIQVANKMPKNSSRNGNGKRRASLNPKWSGMPPKSL